MKIVNIHVMPRCRLICSSSSDIPHSKVDVRRTEDKMLTGQSTDSSWPKQETKDASFANGQKSQLQWLQQNTTIRFGQSYAWLVFELASGVSESMATQWDLAHFEFPIRPYREKTAEPIMGLAPRICHRIPPFLV
jgi:hypothetical protein